MMQRVRGSIACGPPMGMVRGCRLNGCLARSERMVVLAKEDPDCFVGDDGWRANREHSKRSDAKGEVFAWGCAVSRGEQWRHGRQSGEAERRGEE